MVPTNELFRARDALFTACHIKVQAGFRDPYWHWLLRHGLYAHLFDTLQYRHSFLRFDDPIQRSGNGPDATG
jgi:hypothetical protein